MEMCKKTRESEMRHLPAISYMFYVGGRQVQVLWALEWAYVANFFWVNPSYPRSQYMVMTDLGVGVANFGRQI